MPLLQALRGRGLRPQRAAQSRHGGVPTCRHARAATRYTRSRVAAPPAAAEGSAGPPDGLPQLPEGAAFSSVPEALATLSKLRRFVAGGQQPESHEPDERAPRVVLQRWAVAALPLTPQLSARQAAGVMGALSTLYRRGLLPPGSEAALAVGAYSLALLQHFAPSMVDFPVQELMFVLAGAALLCPAPLDEQLLTELEVVVFPKLPQLSGADLAASMWALARLAATAPATEEAAIEAAASSSVIDVLPIPPTSTTSTSTTSTNTSASAPGAAVGSSQTSSGGGSTVEAAAAAAAAAPAGTGAAVPEVEAAHESLDEDELFLALAEGVSWAPDEVWLEAWLQASLRQLPALSNADLAAALSALAQFGCTPAQPWLDALYGVLKTRTGSMSGGELRLLKYACLRLGVAVEVG